MYTYAKIIKYSKTELSRNISIESLTMSAKSTNNKMLRLFILFDEEFDQIQMIEWFFCLIRWPYYGKSFAFYLRVMMTAIFYLIKFWVNITWCQCHKINLLIDKNKSLYELIFIQLRFQTDIWRTQFYCLVYTSLTFSSKTAFTLFVCLFDPCITKKAVRTRAMKFWW